VKPAFLVALAVLEVFMASCSSPDLVVRKQTTGVETNCYLLYDSTSREAAIIDVGGPIDDLLDVIRNEGLSVRYLLMTHGHTDHLIGVPAIRDSLPGASLCMHTDAFADFLTEREWAMATLGEDVLAEWMEHPELRKVVEFDPGTFGEPDEFLEEGQFLRLGGSEIAVLHCPGHARGSLCYSAGGLLFTGDVLFKGSVGRVDGQNSSRADQIASVRRLYSEFADATAVHPGHGESSTIGEERVGNARVSETDVDL